MKITLSVIKADVGGYVGHSSSHPKHHRHYRSREEAMEDITEYIEIFYNRQRLQARLGYLSPATYAQKYYAGLLAA